jgi:tubulin polyglutamylase TTLL6/13
MEQVKDIIVKTIITTQPQLNHLYKISQPECLDNSMAFQILGFDVMIDHKFKPYLLEVNASPSFGTDSSLDYKIKKNVIADAFRLLNFNHEHRIKCIKEFEERTKDRILTGKVYKMTNFEREKAKQEALLIRFKHESTRMRGYELIFPSNDKVKNSLYEKLLLKSNEIFDEFTTGKNKAALLANKIAQEILAKTKTKLAPKNGLSTKSTLNVN